MNPIDSNQSCSKQSSSVNALWLPQHLCEQILIFVAKCMSEFSDPRDASAISPVIFALHPPTGALQRILSRFLMRHAHHICATGDLASLCILRSFKARLNPLGFAVALIHNHVHVMDWWINNAKWDISQESSLATTSAAYQAGQDLDFPMRRAARCGSYAAVRWIVNKYCECQEDDHVYDFCRMGGGSLSDACVGELLAQGGEARELATLCLQAKYPMLPESISSSPVTCHVCLKATQLGLVHVLRIHKARLPSRMCWESAKRDVEWRELLMETAVLGGNVDVVSFWVEHMMGTKWDPQLWVRIGEWARTTQSANAVEEWWKDIDSVRWAMNLGRNT